MKKQIDTTSTTVTFTFEDGLESVTIRTADITPETATRAMLHGLAQKIGDAAAIQKTKDNNYTVTEAMRREAVVGMVDQLTTVGWSAPAGAPKSAAEIKRLQDQNAALMAELEALRAQVA